MRSKMRLIVSTSALLLIIAFLAVGAVAHEFGEAVDFTAQPQTIAHVGSTAPEASTFVKLDASSVSVGPVLFSASSKDNIGSTAIAYSAGQCRLPGIPWFGERFVPLDANNAGQFCSKINCTAMAQNEIYQWDGLYQQCPVFLRVKTTADANVQMQASIEDSVRGSITTYTTHHFTNVVTSPVNATYAAPRGPALFRFTVPVQGGTIFANVYTPSGYTNSRVFFTENPSSTAYASAKEVCRQDNCDIGASTGCSIEAGKTYYLVIESTTLKSSVSNVTIGIVQAGTRVIDPTVGMPSNVDVVVGPYGMELFELKAPAASAWPNWSQRMRVYGKNPDGSISYASIGPGPKGLAKVWASGFYDNQCRKMAYKYGLGTGGSIAGQISMVISPCMLQFSDRVFILFASSSAETQDLRFIFETFSLQTFNISMNSIILWNKDPVLPRIEPLTDVSGPLALIQPATFTVHGTDSAWTWDDLANNTFAPELQLWLKSDVFSWNDWDLFRYSIGWGQEKDGFSISDGFFGKPGDEICGNSRFYSEQGTKSGPFTKNTIMYDYEPSKGKILMAIDQYDRFSFQVMFSNKQDVPLVINAPSLYIAELNSNFARLNSTTPNSKYVRVTYKRLDTTGPDTLTAWIDRGEGASPRRTVFSECKIVDYPSSNMQCSVYLLQGQVYWFPTGSPSRATMLAATTQITVLKTSNFATTSIASTRLSYTGTASLDFIVETSAPGMTFTLNITTSKWDQFTWFTYLTITVTALNPPKDVVPEQKVARCDVNQDSSGCSVVIDDVIDNMEGMSYSVSILPYYFAGGSSVGNLDVAVSLSAWNDTNCAVGNSTTMYTCEQVFGGDGVSALDLNGVTEARVSTIVRHFAALDPTQAAITTCNNSILQLACRSSYRPCDLSNGKVAGDELFGTICREDCLAAASSCSSSVYIVAACAKFPPCNPFSPAALTPVSRTVPALQITAPPASFLPPTTPSIAPKAAPTPMQPQPPGDSTQAPSAAAVDLPPVGTGAAAFVTVSLVVVMSMISIIFM